MNILFIVPRLDKASTRYRVSQYRPLLEAKGLRCEIISLPEGLNNRMKLWLSCQTYDLVVLQKRLLSGWDFFWLRKNSQKLVFDIDDAIMFSDSEEQGTKAKGRTKKFQRTINKVDLIISGNNYLRDCVLKSFKDSNTSNQAVDDLKKEVPVEVLPTPIDLNRYHRKQYSQKETITIGWIGSKVTLRYLENIKPVFEELGKKYQNLVLRIVSDEFIESDSIKVEQIKWTEDNEIHDLHEMDIGIMPLSDNEWTRGKCSFKLLQYMAVGIPVVCSPVGMNREVVIDGEHGYWAENMEDWFGKLSMLIENPSLRKKMGEAGHEQIRMNYNLEKYADNLLKIFELV